MTEIDYDPLSPEVLADPGPFYSPLLEHCPVHRYGGFDPPFYSLSRHDDVRDALRDVATYSSHYGQGPNMSVPGSMQSDPPQHTFFRRLVQQAFTSRAVAEMQPRIEALVDELIAGFVDRGAADIHDELAYPVPTIVIAQMLGVPDSDREVFKEWSDASVAAMSSKTPQMFQPQRDALAAYLIEQARRRLALEAAGEPLPDDLVSRLVTAEHDGQRVSEADLVALLAQLLVGGNETTTSLITNALVRLTEDPTRWERLRAEPHLVEVALEESLRFDPPVLGLFRTTTCPVRLHGEEIPERAKVMLLYAAANRDPRVFDEPDTFSLDRDLDELRRHHLSFGYGIHFCIGAALARMEARIVIAKMVEQFVDLRMTAVPQRIAPFLLWGKKTLPMAWTTTPGSAP
jgi:cytochrome P450